MRAGRWWRVAVAVLGVALAGGGCAGLPDPGASGGPDGGTSGAPVPRGSAGKLLRELDVAKPDDHGHRYDRDRFGEAWADTDGNGCDTRDDVLRRDLHDERFRGGHCTVVSGVLHDRYTGKTIHFRRGRETSQDVQIDHVYPLHAAWQHGAWTWSAGRRERFANDERNLLAVDGRANNDKSDGTPGQWRPPRHAFWCGYATRYVRVAAAYDLSVTTADDRALARMLATCDD